MKKEELEKVIEKHRELLDEAKKRIAEVERRKAEIEDEAKRRRQVPA